MIAILVQARTSSRFKPKKVFKTVRAPSAKPWWLSSRQSLLPYRTRADNWRFAHRMGRLIRVPAVHSATLAALHHWRLALSPGPG